jgi:uncharacterized membrane protein HdeD (DUF308 family)
MVDDITKRWGMVVIQGLLGILIGIIIIVWPTKSLVMTTWLVGLFLLIEGVIVALSAIFQHKKYEHWAMTLLRGLVTLIIGIFIYTYPTMTIGVLYFLLALWLLVGGIVMLVEAVHLRKELFADEWLLAAGGVISILLSIVLMSRPVGSVTVVTVIMGVVILLSGIFKTAYGFQLRSYKGDLKKLES